MDMQRLDSSVALVWVLAMHTSCCESGIKTFIASIRSFAWKILPGFPLFCHATGGSNLTSNMTLLSSRWTSRLQQMERLHCLPGSLHWITGIIELSRFCSHLPGHAQSPFPQILWLACYVTIRSFGMPFLLTHCHGTGTCPPRISKRLAAENSCQMGVHSTLQVLPLSRSMLIHS